MNWIQFYHIIPIPELKPGSVKIGKAEFTAAMIAETFAPLCRKLITTHECDNEGIVRWIEKGRVPVRPFDKIGQAIALMKCKESMKIWCSWIPREENFAADLASKKPQGRIMRINGLAFKRVRPLFNECLHFIRPQVISESKES